MMQGFRSIVFVGWIIGLIIVSKCVHSHDEIGPDEVTIVPQTKESWRSSIAKRQSWGRCRKP
ncbi:MAG: hypothetical protein U0231_13955 [Nitrospiraceae bacterium]